MTRTLVALLLLCVNMPSTCAAAPPDWLEVIRIKVMPVEPDLPPPVNPKLTKGNVYVVGCKKPVIVFGEPQGMAKVVERKGPLTIYATFADSSSDEPQERRYEGPQVFIFTAAKTGREKLFFVPVGLKTADEIFTQIIDCEHGPRPPPDPPGPGPTPQPGPVPIEGVRVLMIWDQNKVLPTGQHSVIYGKKVREYLERKANDFVIWPASTTVEDATRYGKEFGDAMKRPRASPNWLILSNGKTGFEGPLPNTVDEAMTLFKRFFGE